MSSQPSHNPVTPTLDPHSSAAFVRWRAIGIGVVLVSAINSFDPVSRYLIHSSNLTNSHIPFALLVSVLAMAYLYNPVARWLFPKAVLTQRDLAAILTIGFVGGGISNYAQWLVGTISRPYYFSSPENEWPIYVLPNLKPWLYPRNDGGTIAWFYDGLPPDRALPWDVWIVPLIWWLSILGALLVACVSLSVILRKQWSERERLVFPLVELPRLLIEDPESGDRLPAFFGKRLFWIGFSIPAFILLWNVGSHFVPGIPPFGFINSNNLLYVGRGFMEFYMRFDFYVISFAYFTPLNILLSVWLFHILGMVQDGVSKRVGFGPDGYGAGVITQNNYGLIVFVLWGLWMARGQFRDAYLKAIGKGDDIDDSQEMLSYRMAAFGLSGSLLFIYFWLRTLEMSVPLVLVYMFFTFILYLGMAKIVAQSGLVSLRGSGPTGSPKSVIGITNMSDMDIITINQMGALYGQAKGFVMPGASNAGRILDFTELGRRRLGYAVLAGGMLSIIAFIVSSLFIGYEGPGAGNFAGSYFYTGWHFDATVSDIKDKTDAAWEWWWTIGFGVVGAGVTALLILLNQRISWWPLHPIGFTISLQYPTRASFFSVFLAWLFKSIVLRVGGISLFNQSRTFVIGILLGYTFGVVVGFVSDVLFFFGQGHALHTPPL